MTIEKYKNIWTYIEKNWYSKYCLNNDIQELKIYNWYHFKIFIKDSWN